MDEDIPEAIEAAEREVPMTRPFVNVEKDAIEANPVPKSQPIDPFAYANRVWGGYW